MKTITLHFDDDTYGEIRTAIGLRCMVGNAYGVLDAFVMRMVEQVDAGKPEWTVKRKDKKPGDEVDNELENT